MPISASNAIFEPGAEDWWSDFDRKTSPRRKARRSAERVFDNPGYTRTRERAPRALRRRTASGGLTLSRAMMYLAVFVLVTGLVVQVGRLAQIASSAKRISTLTAEIKELRGQKENLEVRLSMQQNLNRIRDEAIYKCDMSYPEEGQVRVVSLMGSGSEPLTQTASNSGEATAAD
jgi:cell division protein FtsB